MNKTRGSSSTLYSFDFALKGLIEVDPKLESFNCILMVHIFDHLLGLPVWSVVVVPFISDPNPLCVPSHIIIYHTPHGVLMFQYDNQQQ